MTKDKTAIELIYEIHEMMTNMEKRLTHLEKNVLLLNDKANGKLFDAITKELPKASNKPAAENTVRKPGKTVIGPDRFENTTSNSQPQRPQRVPNINVFGKFLDMRKKPIAGIEVTVLDANNNVVKQTRTNRAGEWRAYLPPGQYSAEFIKENMAPQFKTFQIVAGQTEVEVL